MKDHHPRRAAIGTIAAVSVVAAAQAAWAQPIEILPDDGGPESRFGYAVAMDDQRMLVGRLNDSSAGMFAGSAYVFRREGDQWVQEAKLLDPVPVLTGHVGTSVSIAGDVAVVGARDEAQTNLIGAALVFRRSGTSWAHEITLRPPDVASPSDGFGYYAFGHAVATDGDRIVVAMPQDDIACPEDPLCNSGSAYVFRYDEGWVMEQKLIPSDPQRLAHFGRAVAMSGDRIVVGAMQADSTAGAVYVFRLQEGTWVEEAKLLNPDAEASVVTQFGEAVAIDGDLIAVGAPGENHVGSYAGAVYVYRLGAGGWTLEEKLVAEDAEQLQFLGQSVAVSGGRVLAGAPWDNRSGTMFRAGAAYLFEHGPSGWTQREKLTDPNGQNEDYLGWTVACRGDTAMVGAQLANRPDLDCGVVLAFALGGTACPADWDGSGSITSSDISAFLTAWLGSIQNGDLVADFNGDATVNSSDISAFLTAWLQAVQGGC